MISILTIGLIFIIALVVTIQFGWAWTYIAVYLPTLILLNQLPELQIPHIPISVQNGPLYAILLGMPFRAEKFRFKICSIDVIFILLLGSAMITAWSTEVFETGINTLRTDFLTLTAPYLLARVVFKSAEMRRACLFILVGLVGFITVCALIEFRLIPYFYQHVLQSMGMGNKLDAMAYNRYGFYRVCGPVEHPIYFGNMFVVILGMIAVLAKTSGYKLKNGWVTAALLGCFGCIVMSVSFTPYVGGIMGTVALLAIMAVPFTRRLVLPGTIVFAIALFAYTYVNAKSTLGDKPDDQFGGSMWTRREIIIESWKKAEAAGAFGFGIRPKFADDEDFDLKSIDNSYMQFTISHGWVYTALWSSIGLLFAWRVSGAFRLVTHQSQVFPLAAATATILGLMVSMYTVWAGALYTVIWAIMLGLANTLIDSVRAAATQPHPLPVQSGPVQSGRLVYGSAPSAGPVFAA